MKSKAEILHQRILCRREVNLSASFAAFALQARKDAGLSVKALALQAHMSDHDISKMEKGTIPTVDDTVRWSRAVGIASDEALVAAGYIPRDVPVDALLSALAAIRCSRLERRLYALVRFIIDANLRSTVQEELAQVLEEFLEVHGVWTVTTPSDGGRKT